MEEKKKIAHNVGAKIRTLDVELDETIDFDHFSLHPLICAGLRSAGFEHPSPIQSKGIPQIMCGRDTFIRAKSGTGKTVVFAVGVLQRFISKPGLSLVLAPTREIAVQICDVITAIGSEIPNFKAQAVIGGRSFATDRQQTGATTCYVGTPGRVVHLIRSQVINVAKVDLLVFDEADRLIETLKTPTLEILDSCTKRKQLLVVSATFPKSIENTFVKYMKNPKSATPKEEAPILLGLSQFTYKIPETTNVKDEMNVKVDHLSVLLGTLKYNQCLIFVNSKCRAETYKNLLLEKGINAECITGDQEQSTRLETFERIKVNPNCRIIVCTDLLSRGIDADRINLVINVEIPTTQETYLHRIGRGGRFGSLSMAVTFISSEEEQASFMKIIDGNFSVYKLTKANAKEASECVEAGKVLEGFELLFTPTVVAAVDGDDSDESGIAFDTKTSPSSNGTVEPVVTKNLSPSEMAAKKDPRKVKNPEDGKEKPNFLQRYREQQKLKAKTEESPFLSQMEQLNIGLDEPVTNGTEIPRVTKVKKVKDKDVSHYENKSVGSEGGIESKSDSDDSFSESSGESNESVFGSTEDYEDYYQSTSPYEVNYYYRRERWMNMFYNQVACIQDHVNSAKILRSQLHQV